MLPPVQVVGFDMVDDESKPERRPTKHSPLPQVRHCYMYLGGPAA
jgi:hypothetical protein